MSRNKKLTQQQRDKRRNAHTRVDQAVALAAIHNLIPRPKVEYVQCGDVMEMWFQGEQIGRCI